MAKAEVSSFLREAARQLELTDRYQWGHMGHCNCGYLAQAVTGRTATEIHRTALAGFGDWTEQLNDYCPATGRGMDDIIGELLSSGFDREDLAHLERLTDPVVLAHISSRPVSLRHNHKEDVIIYLHAWASLLEDQWLMAHHVPEWAINEVAEAEAETEYSLSPGFAG